MAELARKELRTLEKVFELGNGYVSAVFDSNTDMDDFFVDEFGVELYDGEKYSAFGTSKANRLRAYWDLHSDAEVGRCVLAMLKRRAERSVGEDEDKALVEQAEAVARRLLGPGGPAIAAVPHRAIDPLSLQYVQEHDEKCRRKIELGDYDGAITNARSMVETVLLALDKELSGKETPSDGKLNRLYGRVRSELNLNAGQPDLDGPLREILSGLNSIVNGLGTLRNRSGDAHGKLRRAHEHHARLAVHAAVTLTDFLLSTYQYQRSKGS
ncbi:MAG: abortive infection family protein [Nannocystaceae bacterium]|nr:abortive infection family protein [bacterium]